MARYEVWVVFHRQAMQWPLRDLDVLELRDEQARVVARVPTTTAVAILAHHLDELAVLSLFRRAVDPWRKPLSEIRRAVEEPAKRAALRQQRRTRRKA